jgi:TRAP-type C4-dicarboxylate transport system substrate-binding protein
MKNRKTVRLFVCISLVLLLIVMTSVLVCAQPAKVTKLTIANYLPPGNPIEEMLNAWKQDFEAKTGGKYTVEIVSGGALAPLPQSYDALTGGITDISFFSPPMIQKPFPVANLPVLFWGPVSAELMTKAWINSVYRKGYLDKDLEGVKVLATFIGPVGDIETVNRINTLAELKGVKLSNAQGAVCIEFAKRLGAVSVMAPPPDIYVMLQKGITNGLFGSAPMLKEFHLTEFVKYMLPIKVSHMSHVLGMNKDVYNKMPADVKAIVDAMAADDKYSLMAPQGWDEWYNDGVQYFLDQGGKMVEWSKEDMAKVNEIARALWQEEVDKLESQGVPAKKVCDELYNAMKALGAKPSDIAFGYTPGS